MSCNYVVTAQKPTAVNGCVTGNGAERGGGGRDRDMIVQGRPGGRRRTTGSLTVLPSGPPQPPHSCIAMLCFPFRAFHLRRRSELADRQEHPFGNLCGHCRRATARQRSGHVRQNRRHGALPPQGESHLLNIRQGMCVACVGLQPQPFL